MPKYSKELGISVAGLAGFQLLNAWNNNAPSLKALREADPHDPEVKRQLLDTDILVGGTALIIGTSVAILTQDSTALLIMLAIYGTATLWAHVVFGSESV